MKRTLAGLGSLLALVGIFAGTAFALVALAGWPLPTVAAVRTALQLHYFPPHLIEQLAACVAWPGLVFLLFAVLRMAIDAWRERPATHRGPSGVLHALVLRAVPILVVCAGLVNRTPAWSAPPTATAASAQPAPSASRAVVSPGSWATVSTPTGRSADAPPRADIDVAPYVTPGTAGQSVAVRLTTAPTPGSTAAGASATAGLTYRVVPGDELWDVAETQLHDPLQWKTIWQLNQGRTMVDVDGGQRVFDDPNLIEPGWELLMPNGWAPAAAQSSPAAPDLPAPPAASAGATAAPAGGAAASGGTAAAGGTATPAATSVAPSTPGAAPAAPRTIPGTASPAATRGGPVVGHRPPPVPAPAPPTGSTGLLSRPAGATGEEEIGAAVGVVALAAGGVGLSRLLRERSARRLRALRSQQASQRKAGRSVLQPGGPLAELELGVERAAAGSRPVGHLLDSALRAMAAGVTEWASEQLPEVVAVHLCASEAAVELQLAGPRPTPPPGFAAPNPYCWRSVVSAEELAHLGADAANPCPCLVTVGASPAGEVLVDLERAGVLSVEGPPALVAALLSSAAAELACDSPSHHVVVRVVGTAGTLDALADVEDLDLAALPAQFEGHRSQIGAGDVGTFESRVRSEGSELYSPMVAVVAGGTVHDLANLSEICLPGSGVAVIASGPVPGTRWRLRLSATEARLDRLGLVMDRVETADAEALGELLAARANIDGVADVVELRPAAAAPQADVDTVDTPPQGVLVDTTNGSGDDGEGSEDRGSAVVRPRVLVLCDRPHVQDWARVPTVKDGPVEEVVVRLTIADGPLSAEQLYDQIWASRVRFRDGYRKLVSEGVSRARLCLGHRYIPNASKGMYRIDLASDLGDFRRLVVAADRSTDPAEELATLGQALALVTGTPFKVVTSGSYDSVTIDAGALPAIQRLVGNAAHQAVQLALRLGEVERASWAADKGLLVLPVSEQLWQDRALAAEAAEDDEAIDTIHRRAMEATGGLSIETEEWFAQMVGRRRSTRQWRVRGLSGAPNGNGSAADEKVGRRG